MMLPSVAKNQAGFTLVELVMAMAVFSFMLTIIMVGFLGVVKTHESGVVQRNTQQNARLAMDQLSKAAQRSSQAITIVTSPATVSTSEIDKVCLASFGQNLVFEVKPIYVSASLTVQSLTLGTISAGQCKSAATFTRLTDNSSTVTQFKVTTIPKLGASLGAIETALSVASAYGVSDLDGSKQQTSCSPGPGSQFCSVTTIDSTAALRGAQ